MPTNRELQDELDELRLNLEEAEETGRARNEELAALRGELAASEARGAAMQGMLDSLAAGQSSLETIYKEREQLLLGRISQAARNMEEREAELEGEVSEALGRAQAAEDEAKRLNSWAQSQLAQSRERETSFNRVRAENDRLQRLLERYEKELTEARAEPQPGLITQFLGALVPRPGCLVLLTLGTLLIVSVIWLLISIFSSTTPPDDILGR